MSDVYINKELEDRLTFKQLNENQKLRCEKIRQKLLDILRYIDGNCPNGREKSLALTKLEECMMWSNKSISREK